jgi:hypothetical protein
MSRISSAVKNKMAAAGEISPEILRVASLRLDIALNLFID